MIAAYSVIQALLTQRFQLFNGFEKTLDLRFWRLNVADGGLSVLSNLEPGG